MAERLKPCLDEIISINQSGFVPERKIEEAIDKMNAGMEMLYRLQGETGVLLIDIAKAYDTLDREFLFEILFRMGFPKQFINIIQFLHKKTTAQFIVNGFLSSKFPVERGIRQGCPLAPLLFIIATEFLYQMLQESETSTNIEMEIENQPLQLSTIGFVDDTSVFFRDTMALKLILQKLELFGKFSGLKVQPTKSKIITYHSYNTKTLMKIPLLQKDEKVRFLGLVIGKNIKLEEAWEWYIAKMIRRIFLLTNKNSSTLQRLHLCQAIIQAKIRFFSQHYFPNEKIIKTLEKIQTNFIWYNIASQEKIKRNKISKDLLQVKKKEGGLGLPGLRQILHKISISRVTSWATNPTSQHGKCIRLLLHTQIADANYNNLPQDPQQELYLQARIVRKQKTSYPALFLVGAIQTQQLLNYCNKYETNEKISQQRQIWYNNLEVNWNNNNNIRFSLPKMSIPYWQKYKQMILTETFHTSYIKKLYITENPLIRDLQNNILKLVNYPFLKSNTTISDLFEFQEIDFNPFRIQIKITKEINKKRKLDYIHLIKLIITLYPNMLKPENEISLVKFHPEFHHSKWILNKLEEDRRTINCITNNKQIVWAIANDGITCKNEYDEKTIIIKHHAAISRIVTTYHHHNIQNKGETLKWETWKKKIKEQKIYQEANQQKFMSIKKKWLNIGREKFILEQEVKCIYENATSTRLEKEWDQIFYYRFLTWSLNFWYKDRKEKATCSLCYKGKDNMEHLYLECNLSQEVFQHFNCNKSNWYQLILEIPILINEDPIISSANWKFGAEKEESISTKEKLQIQKRIYQLFKKTLLWCLWKNRCMQVHEQEGITTLESLKIYIKNQILHQIFKFSLIHPSIRSKKYIEKVKISILAGNFIKSEFNMVKIDMGTNTQTIMLFDGGSRENPGPGGSGSVIITGRFINNQLILMDLQMISAFINNNTTNNIAEYTGFYLCLVVNKGKNKKVKVIGDSQLVLNQLTLLKISKNNKLQEIQENIYHYLQFYELIEYNHHYRNKNKTADLLANQAMDKKNLTQISMKEKGKKLENTTINKYLEYLENDLNIKIKNKESIALYQREYKRDQSQDITDTLNQIRNCLD